MICPRTTLATASARCVVGALCLAWAGNAAAGWSVYRTLVDGALSPAANEVQEAGPERRVIQTFAPPQEPIAGVELFVSRYPRHESLEVAIRVTQGERELGFGVVPIRDDVSRVTRLTFAPVRADDQVAIEAWAPRGRPGHNASILFYPVDHYPQGELLVGGRRVQGDAVFRVLAPDSSRFDLVPGLDLSTVVGRFPSDRLPSSGGLTQEFISPADSLAGIEFLTGTGGMPFGPPLAWDLLRDGVPLRSGLAEATYDNVALRLLFDPVTESQGRAFSLNLSQQGHGELRLWLCAPGPDMGRLTLSDRMVNGSLVMTTLHPWARTDSLRVVLAADSPLLPEPGLLVAGSCVLTQSFLWPQNPGTSDCVGLRLALGERLSTGHVPYHVWDEETGEVVHRDSVELGGRGKNDYIWFDLGRAPRGRRLSIALGGHGANAETAARFWWMPVSVYRDGEAGGCVPRPGGECLFRLGTRYSLGQWVLRGPALSAQSAPPGSAALLTGLLAARLVLIVALGIALCLGRVGMRDS